MTNFSSHPEWVLTQIIGIDSYLSGFCGAFLRDTISIERRQVISAYLSAKKPAEDEMFEVGQFLLSETHSTILAAAFGSVPAGLRGALRRSGSVVHPECYYGLLYELLARPEAREVARCVAHLNALDLEKLLIIKNLPRAICRPNVVVGIRTESEAADVAAALRLLADRGIDKSLLIDTISGVRGQRGLTRVFRGLVRKAEAPPHPIPSAEGYAPLASGDDLYRVALEFRNCLRSYTCRFLNEEEGHAFAVAQNETSKAVVHLKRQGMQWKLEGLFGPRNSRPTRAMREKIASHLTAHGVEVDPRPRRSAPDWEALRRLTSEDLLGFDFEFELEGVELDE